MIIISGTARELSVAMKAAEHMAAFMGQMGDFGVTEIDLSSYRASDKTKFM